MSIRGVWGVEDFPIKKQFHTPVAIHLLERSEVYYKQKNKSFICLGFRYSGGCVGFLHGYNKMATAWDACISVGLPFYCVWCWLFNIMATYRTFRVGCLHKRGEKYYKTALCYLASGSFFWRRFLFCAVGAALYFFQLTFKKSISFSIEKIMCCKCVGYKNYDKKN